MASFSASIVTKHEEGATFVFGPWLFIANKNGDLCREDRDDVGSPRTDHAAPALHRVRIRYDLWIVSDPEKHLEAQAESNSDT